MKHFPILSGSAYVVELPETQWPYRDLNYKIRAELGKPLAGKMLVRGSNSLWQEVDLPTGYWRIVGMLSEVAEEQAAGLVDSKETEGAWPFADVFTMDYISGSYTLSTALESLESAIQVAGWYFENPVKIHTWASENADDYRKQWEEGKKRVLSRERCVILQKVN
ncbi:hypothetical protein [Parapedobacter lycopersici]|uniref:hypothetical protein n=1 Tax=Parapedobacter lycopersici TaxID=1864939 RepID=UPI00214DA2C6|nr:hypothetical protein [Parapedobacter lycopersici]